MKTTIDIADPLLRKARTVAAKRGTTLRALVEQGLRQVVTEQPAKVSKLRDARFGGQGLSPEFANATWEEILNASYGDRGGDSHR